MGSRTDVFCLGVTLYEVLSGRLPFGRIPSDLSGQEIAEELLRRQRLGPRPLRSANSGVNSSLAKVVESCLAFEPVLRPPSADSLAQALHRTVAKVPRAPLDWQPPHELAGAAAGLCLAASTTVAAYWATRPPYAERQFRLGRIALVGHEYDDAVLRFTRSS